jgi:hypothetical protein
MVRNQVIIANAMVNLKKNNNKQKKRGGGVSQNGYLTVL